MDSTPSGRGRHPEFARSLARTLAALDFADERHAGQRRRADDAPFVVHPIEVATILYQTGFPDDVIAAGVLHDVLESTDTTAEEIEARFGSRVALLVTAVTENAEIENDADRKAALRLQVARSGEDAAAVFAADKISRVRELRLMAGRGGPDPPSREKLAHYEASLEMLAQEIPEHALVERLRLELEAVRALPAGGV
jgi:(p)ppGpp synthase/HD superfamily hydrolase